jgi:general secretion pathway protein J
VRASWDVLDRAQNTEPRSANLLAGVTALEIRYLDGAGEWHLDWPPASTSAPTAATRLPRAIEINLDIKDWGRITRLFRVAAPQQAAAS